MTTQPPTLPKIKDLTYYPDGELPAEILAQYPANSVSELQRPKFAGRVAHSDLAGQEVQIEKLSGMLTMLTILLICGGMAILALMEANYKRNDYAPLFTDTPTPIPAGIICLATNNQTRPISVWGEGATVIGSLEVGESVFITYEHTAVYHILPEGKFAGGYVSAQRVQLDCDHAQSLRD